MIYGRVHLESTGSQEGVARQNLGLGPILGRSRTTKRENRYRQEIGRMPLLKVDRTQFVEAVEVLAGMTKRNRTAKAMLTFTNNVLSIKVGSTTMDVNAAGDWNGVAKTNGQAFLFACRDLPATDPLIVKIDVDRLLIERRSVPCDWIEFKTRITPVKQ